MRLESPIVDAAGLLVAVLMLTIVASTLRPLVTSPAQWMLFFHVACVATPVAVFTILRRNVLAGTWRWPTATQTLVAAAMGAAIAFANMGLVIPLVPVRTPSTTAVARAIPSMSLPVALTVLALIPAITEELLFRGVVLQAIARRSRLGALVVSAALFSAFHMSAAQLAPLFVVGLAAGAAFLLSRSLIIPIVVHASNNAMVLAVMTTPDLGIPGLEAGGCAIAVLLALLGVLAFLSARQP